MLNLDPIVEENLSENVSNLFKFAENESRVSDEELNKKEPPLFLFSQENP